MIQRYSIISLFILLVITGLVSCSESLENQLKNRAKDDNKQCPKMLDKWTRIDSCATNGHNYQYYHTIIDYAISDTTLFKTSMIPQIVSNVRINPEMALFKENNITLEYKYNTKEGGYICSIIVEPNDYK